MSDIFREHVLPGVDVVFGGKNREGFEEVDRGLMSLRNSTELWQLEALKKLKERMKWPDLHFNGEFLMALCRG